MLPGPRRRRPTPYDAVAGAAVLAVLTEWDEFRWLDFDRVPTSMEPPSRVVDARNLLDPRRCAGAASPYEGVGR